MKKPIFDKLKSYIEMILAASAVASALWYGAVVPRFKRIIKNEVGFAMYLIMEMATNEQIERATKKWNAFKNEED